MRPRLGIGGRVGQQVRGFDDPLGAAQRKAVELAAKARLQLQVRERWRPGSKELDHRLGERDHRVIGRRREFLMLNGRPPAGGPRAFLADRKQAGLVAADQHRRRDADHHDQDRQRDAKPRQGHDGKHKRDTEDNWTAVRPRHASQYNAGRRHPRREERSWVDLGLGDDGRAPTVVVAFQGVCDRLHSGPHLGNVLWRRYHDHHRF